MKKIYIIRHGESECNFAKIGQSPESSLSDIGRKQAGQLAERLGKMEFDTLISSHFKRALETAEIVAQKTGHKIEILDFIYERNRPSVLRGVSINDDEFQRIQKIIDENISNPDFKYSDEETMFEIVDRAKEFKHFLENNDSQTIVAVSHGFFIRVFLGIIVLGDDASVETIYRFVLSMVTSNTGITKFKILDDGKWKLITYGDYSHLN